MPVKVVKSPEFEILPSFEVPIMSGTKLPCIDATAAKSKMNALASGNRKGCYIFALEFYGKMLPWYVGKAAKSTFATEVFNDSNCKKYCEAIAIAGRGKPHIFLIGLPSKKGPVNEKAIEKLETWLIEACGGTNSNIRNKRKTEIYEIMIRGVINTSQGRRSSTAESIRQMMGLN